jgi:hypothetical protein
MDRIFYLALKKNGLKTNNYIWIYRVYKNRQPWGKKYKKSQNSAPFKINQ